jgi:hypothetical protein
LIDLEEGVINRTMTSPIASLFDSQLSLTDTTGAGNNWFFFLHPFPHLLPFAFD